LAPDSVENLSSDEIEFDSLIFVIAVRGQKRQDVLP